MIVLMSKCHKLESPEHKVSNEKLFLNALIYVSDTY